MRALQRSAGPTTSNQASAASAGRAPTALRCQAAAVPSRCGACRQPALLPRHCCCQAACAPARRWPMGCWALPRGWPPPPLWEGKGGGEDEKGGGGAGRQEAGQCARLAQWTAGRLPQQAQHHAGGTPGTHQGLASGLTFPWWRLLGHRWEIKQLPGVYSNCRVVRGNKRWEQAGACLSTAQAVSERALHASVAGPAAGHSGDCLRG